MGAKTWMLVYAESDARVALSAQPQLDREATARLAKKLFPRDRLTAQGDGDLLFTSPPDDEIYVGCFHGVSIIAAAEFGIDYPSALPDEFLKAANGGKIYLHAMHSVVDWFAFGVWSDGKLVRSLSLSPDSGILENKGEPLAFERPYWAGERPAVDEEGAEEEPYPFPFHPLELGEAALDALFGYHLEGFQGAPSPVVAAEQIALVRHKRSRSRPWWKFWMQS